MLHGMLVHLAGQIEQLLSLGGPEVQETVQRLRALASQEATPNGGSREKN
jgi:hypothetical protein